MSAGFSLKKIKTSATLGQRFKKARKKLGIDLIDAEMQTKIRSKHLQALESDDYMNLPADAYTKGFVIRYAKFLNLDETKSLSDYYQLRSRLYENNDDIINPNKSFREVHFIITPKIFTPIALGLMVVGLFSYLAFQIYGFAAAPELSIVSPNNNSIVESENIEIKGTTNQLAEVYINEQKIQVASDGTFNTDYKMMPGINVIQIKSRNKANKEKSLTYTLEYKSQSARAGSAAEQNRENYYSEEIY